jgi:FKBP-type peptidyl-prolyl cis-trans isomerase 2
MVKVFDTSEGKEPRVYFGTGKLIPRFEKANRYEIKRKITISQEDAYGEAPRSNSSR